MDYQQPKIIYDPFSLNPPKAVIKSALTQYQAKARRLLDDIASLRQNDLAGWLIEKLEAEHKKVIHKITRLQMYLRDINPSDDWELSKLRAKLRPITEFFPNVLRKSGNRFYGRCPFHSDGTPSFIVYIDQNKYHCFAGCGGGDVIDFVSKLHNLDFKQAVEFLNK